MDKVHAYRRAVFFVISVMIMALGVVLSTIAVLGTSPISSVPWVLSLGTGYSLGLMTLFVNVFIILAGVLIMRRDFKVIYLGEIVMVFILSVMCDVFSDLLSFIDLDNYAVQWAFIVLAAIVLAFGISLEVAANVTMMPGEFLVVFMVFRTHRDFGKCKVAFDVTMIVIAAALSLYYFGELRGVREGTVFAALVVGPIARQFTAVLKKHGFYDWIGHKDITGKNKAPA